MDPFRKSWRFEYLLELRSADRYPVATTYNLEVDDVVIVENCLVSKPYGELGSIVETYPAVDRIVRARSKLKKVALIKIPMQNRTYWRFEILNFKLGSTLQLKEHEDVVERRGTGSLNANIK